MVLCLSSQAALSAPQDMTSTAFGDDIIVDYLASSFAAMRDMGPAVYRPFMQACQKPWPRALDPCMHLNTGLFPS